MRSKIIFLLLCLLSGIVHASPVSLSVSLPAIPTEPSNLTGGQIFLNYHYQEKDWAFGTFNLLFDLGFSHFQTPSQHYSSINIYSASPIFRFYFMDYRCLYPYLDISVGVSYLTRTRIEKRRLGIHFAFQDRLGAGIAFGAEKKITAGIGAIHYSNAHLSQHNSGITILMALNLSYRF